MKPSTLVCFLLFMAGVLLVLFQMWFHYFSPDMFSKIFVTDIGLFIIAIVLTFLVRENKESKKIDSGHGLD